MSLKALHVIPTLDILAGGTSAALSGMASAQAQAGIKVSVVATYAEDGVETFAPFLTEQGVDVTLLGPTSGSLRRHPDLEPTLRQQIPAHDVVHVHGLWEEPLHLAFKLARELGRPAMLSPHGMLDRWSLEQSKLKKQIYLAWRLRKHLKHVDAFHFTTDEERESVGRFGYPGKPMVVPLGLDLDEFDPLPDAGRFRARYPKLGDKPYALFLSRLHHKKGLELLLPAFAQLREQHPDWRLVVAGPPENDAYLESLQALTKSLGMVEDEEMFFVGMQRGAERIEAMVDASFFVLPSYQENFGIVVAEAGAAGLPLVISEHVNLASYVESNELGTITVQDVDQLRQSLDQTIRRDDLADVGRRARSTTLEHFDWKNIGRRWIDVYGQLTPNPDD
ncbi:glycosyltransferase [Algisphaera agarilytica]|uniref:Glycosyltransferase involved in cell wall biosynthesis n=1 Tax=Algisphaera agarilytica TaxID=1385975 RepID=A0A7X0H7P9_9BACT|nr:glycosyltransferase [Algisphaera agarilytica]MBB6430789.1 glycosyltransferase involved in cell wall biosynthesis [Algisphaera agarilytica]